MTIGQRIKQLRENYNISQTDLAKSINITKQNLYKYETGIITNIPSDKIELIAKFFDVNPAYIMGWEKNQEQTKPGIDITTQQALDLYLQLDSDDRAEIRGEMKQMLKSEKYFEKDILSKKKMA